MLTVQDTRMVEIILEGLTNILKVGKNYSVQGVNPFSTQIEEAYGMCMCRISFGDQLK